MTRSLPPFEARDHGRALVGGEPLVFHCNFYNYWLQKTMLLDPGLEMEAVVMAAAAESAAQMLTAALPSLDADTPEARERLACDTFAELGFGTLDLTGLTPDGGVVSAPVSHYGSCLRQAVGEPFATPQSLFDAGYAAAAAAFVLGLPAGSFTGEVLTCPSTGPDPVTVRLTRSDAGPRFGPVVHRAHSAEAPPPPFADTHVDESAILAALGTLDFSGNEEGLIPRFGVMLTRHFASFYNRQSFEFVRAMDAFEMRDAAEMLLMDTAYRCAFHTFGGIMTSAEWDAVIKPQCKTQEDWIHGMVACVNALGWGVWRVVDHSENHLRIRIWDDYESTGWLDMYGEAKHPVSYLAAGAVSGIMNLIYNADIASKPTLDLDFYAEAFEADGAFEPEQVTSMAMGAPYTEIVARR